MMTTTVTAMAIIKTANKPLSEGAGGHEVFICLSPMQPRSRKMKGQTLPILVDDETLRA